MKKHVLAAAILLAPCPVLAADGWSDFYAEVYGGISQSTVLTWYSFGSVDSTYQMESRAVFGGAVGIQTPVDNLALELDALVVPGTYVGYPNDFHDTLSLMVNGVYTVPLGDRFDLYGKLGAGVVVQHYHAQSNGADSTAAGLGYQAAVGANVMLTDNISLFGELRHQDTFQPVNLQPPQYSVSRPTTVALVGIRFDMN
ncbi:MAG: porin family protein [Devosia sp.]